MYIYVSTKSSISQLECILIFIIYVYVVVKPRLRVFLVDIHGYLIPSLNVFAATRRFVVPGAPSEYAVGRRKHGCRRGKLTHHRGEGHLPYGLCVNKCYDIGLALFLLNRFRRIGAPLNLEPWSGFHYFNNKKYGCVETKAESLVIEHHLRFGWKVSTGWSAVYIS